MKETNYRYLYLNLLYTGKDQEYALWQGHNLFEICTFKQVINFNLL